ncbi:hypothetical protein [Microbulbifer sp. ZKSA002]|uniref:hypothetical protein n=1 Tax=Microbulbifer sp. ZKSA002 TaxID=3243388 RepID=UPI0040392EC5
MYFQYLEYLYILVYLVCAYLAYKIVKVEYLLFHLKFSRCENKAEFLGYRFARILLVIGAIGGAVYTSKWFSSYTAELQARAKAELTSTSSPNKMYCIKKVAGYFEENILVQKYFVPSYYQTCLEITPHFSVKNFCGAVRDEYSYRGKCHESGLSRGQCDVLYKIAWRHCAVNA